MRIGTLGFGILAVALTVCGAAFADGGGGMSRGGSMDIPQRQMTPEEQAKASYNSGVRSVKAADKFEKTADEAKDEKKKAKALDRAKKAYEKARGQFAAAVQRQPQMHEAWNYVGYTSRKLGEYDKALAAYDEALRLSPTYAEAIEYRGEAYLGLNRIEDAKAAYMQLFQSSRSHADQLMAAMQRWVSDRRGDTAGVAPAEIDSFAQWVDERTNIARQTASLATDAAAPRWN
jgi:tetratricopeptide (TPR) repeat protein